MFRNGLFTSYALRVLNRQGPRVCIVFATLLLLFLTGCGGTSRPSVAEWQPAWEGIVDDVHAISVLGQPPDHSTCNHVLGNLRSSRGQLFPTPDPAIDNTVTEWLRVAEHALFECPTSPEEIPDMTDSYAELVRLEAEVEVVLAIDSADG